MMDLPPLRPISVPPNFDIRRSRGTPPPDAKSPPRTIDAETVIVRLEEAGRTLLSLSRGGSPPPPAPPAVKITRMDQALAWVHLIPAEQRVLRRIVGCRCLVSPVTGRHLFSWRRLARLLCVDHKAIQRWHGTGIDLIVAALKQDAAIVQVWDRRR